MKKLLLIVMLVCAVCVQGQVTSQNAKRIYSGTAVPNWSCSPGPTFTDFYLRTTTDVLYYCSAAPSTWTVFVAAGTGGSVTSVSVVTANGFSGSVATATTTPAITINNPSALVATTSIASPFYVSTAANPADAGAVRLGNTELLAWEAVTPGTDLTLGVNASDLLTTNAAFSALTLTGQGLTSGRVPIVSTGGLISDDAGLTYNVGTDALSVSGNMVAGGTQNAFGAVNTTALLNVSTAITGSANAAGIRLVSVLTPTTGNDVFGVNSSPTAGSAAENVDDAAAFKAGAVIKGNAGTLTNVYGVLVDSQTAASTNAYGLYVNGPSGGSSLNIAAFFNGSVSAASYLTGTNCSDSAGAAACGSAAAGTVVIDAGATTVVVSTTAVTANSEVFAQFDSSLGTRLSVTCNTTPAIPAITARTAGTSFTITVPAAPITNPACYSYRIVN